MCQFCTFAIYRTSTIVCSVRLCKCAFCFAEHSMSFLDGFAPPRAVWMCWYLIWHPSPLPHNPRALKEADILQPFLSCLSIDCCFGVLIRRLFVHHDAWVNVQRCFVSSPQATSPFWWDGRQLHYVHALFEILSSWCCRVGIFLLCCCGKRIILTCDWWISFAAIWYDRACHFCYLISVFAVFLIAE